MYIVLSILELCMPFYVLIIVEFVFCLFCFESRPLRYCKSWIFVMNSKLFACIYLSVFRTTLIKY